MKTNTLVVLLLFFCLNLFSANAQTFDWVKQIGAVNSGVMVNAMTFDSFGNVYLTGVFLNTLDLDPGLGVNSHISNGIRDIFILKLDSSGNFIWAKTMGGVGDDWGIDISLDSMNNIFCTGRFQNTVDFDPDSNVYLLTSTGINDIFYLKLNANGNFMWAQSIGGISYDVGVKYKVDSDGYLYAIGRFSGTVDFDPGIGIFNLISSTNSNIYIAKFNPNGNFVYAKQFGGTSCNVNSFDLFNSNIWLQGTFQTVADFDPDTSVFNLYGPGIDTYILKLDTSANFVTVLQFGDSASHTMGNDMNIDLEGNIYSTGYFNDSVDFDPGIGIYKLHSNGMADAYVAKLDSNGNFLWANSFGSYQQDYSNSLCLDNNGSVYLTGRFIDTAYFGAGSNFYNLYSNGEEDIFITKYDSNGTFIWANSIGGIDSEAGMIIESDMNQNIYTSGFFSDNVYFNPPSLNMLSSSFFDYFILKYSPDTFTSSEILNPVNFKVYPNPTNNLVVVEFEKVESLIEIRLLNIIGQELFHTKYHNTDKIQINVTEGSGIYLLELLGQNFSSSRKIIKY